MGASLFECGTEGPGTSLGGWRETREPSDSVKPFGPRVEVEAGSGAPGGAKDWTHVQRNLEDGSLVMVGAGPEGQVRRPTRPRATGVPTDFSTHLRPWVRYTWFWKPDPVAAGCTRSPRVRPLPPPPATKGMGVTGRRPPVLLSSGTLRFSGAPGIRRDAGVGTRSGERVNSMNSPLNRLVTVGGEHRFSKFG